MTVTDALAACVAVHAAQSRCGACVRPPGAVATEGNEEDPLSPDRDH
jgi:hypothetical protein